MSEHYYVRTGVLQDRPCKWASTSPNKWNWDKYMIYQAGWKGNINIFRLEDIEASGSGMGTVFIKSLADEAYVNGAKTINGEFAPRGIRERVRTWYENHGFEINDESELVGDVGTVAVACMKILRKYSTTYELISF